MFCVEGFDPEVLAMFDTIGLFYDEERNLFTGDDGFIVYDIFRIINPNTLFRFKLKKTYSIEQSRDGRIVEMFYGDNGLSNY